MKALFFSFLMFLAAVPGTLFGQTAQLTGSISDPSGAVIPGAQVTLENIATGVKREAISGDQGYYTIPLLEPGTYQMNVRMVGFKTVNRSGINLTVNQVARIDIVMEVGEITDNINVLGGAPTVERDTAALGTVIGNKNITDLPLNQRNPYLLALLAPGVIPSTVNIQSGMGQYLRTATFMVNGGRVQNSEFLLDGVSNTTNWSEVLNSVPVMPSVESVHEFKVQTNSYSAEFGRSAGGVINVVMKSGTNEFHGSVFEFLRNSKLDANSFFANRSGARLPDFERNQFGGSFGGPVIRDKVFFFATFEALRAETANDFTTTVPTELERRGDFSKTTRLVGGNCVPVQVFDPATTRPNPQGRGFVRDAFANSTIPSTRLDAVGARMVQLYPKPNSTGAPCTGANNFFSSKPQPEDAKQIDAKVDWVLSQKDQLFLGLNWRTHETVPPNHYGTIANHNVAGISDPSGGLRLNYTRIQTSSLLFNVKFGISRAEREIPPHGENLKVTDFGFSEILQSQMRKPIDVPSFRATGYGNLGNSCCAFAFLAATTYNLNGNASWVRGNHSLKFGVDARKLHSFEDTGFGTSGSFLFDRGFTQGPDPNVSRVDRGDALASLLLGAGNGFVQFIPGIFTTSEYYALYFQDDVKLTNKLTLNLGLRYDVETGRDERNDQLSFFDFKARSPLAGKVPQFPNLEGGLRFVGIDADRQFDTDWNNFGPRVGLAYSINPKTIIRMGYGIFYPPYIGGASGAGAGFAGFQSFTPWLSSLDGLTPVNYLSNPFPTGLELPTGSQLGLLTNVGSGFGDSSRDGAIERHARVGYVQQWNFNVQRELPNSIHLELAYAGSKGTRLPNGPFGIQENQLKPEHLKLGSDLQKLVPNPFFGIIETRGPLSQPRVTQGQLLRPYPHFLNVLNFRPDSASSIYHSFQLRVQKHFASGLTFLVAYTNSKLINDSDHIVNFWGHAPGTQNAYDRRSDRSLSGMDVSQRLVLNYVYELPFGNGKHFGNGWSGVVQHVLGGWQVNGIVTLARGVPLSLSAVNTSGAFSEGLRPNMSGDAQLSGDRSTSEKLSKWFDTSKFSQPQPFTFGNAPRTLPNIRGDEVKNVDFSVFKQFAVAEHARIEVRGEFFNFLNTPQFGFPDTRVGSSTFGAVFSQSNIPRQVQLAVKFLF